MVKPIIVAVTSRLLTGLVSRTAVTYSRHVHTCVRPHVRTRVYVKLERLCPRVHTETTMVLVGRGIHDDETNHGLTTVRWCYGATTGATY